MFFKDLSFWPAKFWLSFPTPEKKYFKFLIFDMYKPGSDLKSAGEHKLNTLAAAQQTQFGVLPGWSDVSLMGEDEVTLPMWVWSLVFVIRLLTLITYYFKFKAKHIWDIKTADTLISHNDKTTNREKW